MVLMVIILGEWEVIAKYNHIFQTIELWLTNVLYSKMNLIGIYEFEKYNVSSYDLLKESQRLLPEIIYKHILLYCEEHSLGKDWVKEIENCEDEIHNDISIEEVVDELLYRRIEKYIGIKTCQYGMSEIRKSSFPNYDFELEKKLLKRNLIELSEQAFCQLYHKYLLDNIWIDLFSEKEIVIKFKKTYIKEVIEAKDSNMYIFKTIDGLLDLILLTDNTNVDELVDSDYGNLCYSEEGMNRPSDCWKAKQLYSIYRYLDPDLADFLKNEAISLYNETIEF